MPTDTAALTNWHAWCPPCQTRHGHIAPPIDDTMIPRPRICPSCGQSFTFWDEPALPTLPLAEVTR
jgi:hypothetical protein